MRRLLWILLGGFLLVTPSISHAGSKFKPPRFLEFTVEANPSSGHFDIRTTIQLHLSRFSRRAFGPDVIWLNPRGGTAVNPGTIFLSEDRRDRQAHFVAVPNCNETAVAVYRLTPDNRLVYHGTPNGDYEIRLPNRKNGARQDYVFAFWCEGYDTFIPRLVSIESSASPALDRHRGYR